MNNTVELKIWPPAKTAAERIAELIVDVDAVTSYRLLNGFQWKPPQRALPESLKALYLTDNDVPVMTFATALTDQGNMTQTAIDAMTSAGAGNTAWATAWRGWLNGKAYDLVIDLIGWNDFSATYAVSKRDHLGLGWVNKAKLETATTAAEADKFFNEFGYSSEELTAAKESFAATL